MDHTHGGVSAVLRPRVVPREGDGLASSSSSALFVTAGKGIPWDALVPRVTVAQGSAGVAAAASPPSPTPSVHSRALHGTEWRWPPQHRAPRPHHDSSPVSQGVTPAEGSPASRVPPRKEGAEDGNWCVAQAPRGWPSLDGFAFRSLQGRRGTTAAGGGEPAPQQRHEDVPVAAVAPPPVDRAAPPLRHPIATLQYYAAASQPYSYAEPSAGEHLRRDEGETAPSSSTQPTLAPLRDDGDDGRHIRAAVGEGRADDDEPEVEAVEEIAPTPSLLSETSASRRRPVAAERGVGNVRRLQRSYSGHSATSGGKRSVPTSPSFSSTGSGGGAAPRAARLDRSRRRTPSRRFSRTASLSEGRPLYPHLKEQQNLHTRGLLRLPSPTAASSVSLLPSAPADKAKAAAAAHRPGSGRSRGSSATPGRSLSSSSSFLPARTEDVVDAGAGQQRTAQWLVRILEDCTHQVSLQQQRQQRHPQGTGSRQHEHVLSSHGVNPQQRPSATASSPSSSSPAAECVAELLASFLAARYGAVRWQSALENVARALHCFHRASPLVGIFRRYFTTPLHKVADTAAAASRDAVEGVGQDESESARALKEFRMFCAIKSRSARNSFTVTSRVTVPVDPPVNDHHNEANTGLLANASLCTTVTSRRYFRLHNIAVELAEVLEAVAIEEVVVLPAKADSFSDGNGPRGQQTREPSRLYYLANDSMTSRGATTSPGSRFVTEADVRRRQQPVVVRLHRRLRRNEVNRVLDLVLAWIARGRDLVQAEGGPHGKPRQRWEAEEDPEGHTRLAFDRVGCVDADAAVQALVEAMGQVCPLHLRDARRQWAARSHAHPEERAIRQREDDVVRAAQGAEVGARGGAEAPTRSAVLAASASHADPSTTSCDGRKGDNGEEDRQHAAAGAATSRGVGPMVSPEYLDRLARFHSILRHSTAHQELTPSTGDRCGKAVNGEGGSPRAAAEEKHTEGDDDGRGDSDCDSAKLPPSPPPRKRASTPSPSEVERELGRHRAGDDSTARGPQQQQPGKTEGGKPIASESTNDGSQVKPLVFDSSSLLETSAVTQSVTATGEPENRPPRQPSPYILRHALSVRTAAPPQHLAQTLAAMEADLRKAKALRHPQQPFTGVAIPSVKERIFQRVPPPLSRAPASSSSSTAVTPQVPLAATESKPTARPREAENGSQSGYALDGARVVRGGVSAEEAEALAELDEVLRVLRERRRRVESRAT